MRLASYIAGNQVRLGALSSNALELVDISAASQALDGKPAPAAFASLLALIEAGPEALDRARAVVEAAEDQRPPEVLHTLDAIQLTTPLQPPRMLCFSVYDEHVKRAFESVIRLRAGRVIGGMVKGMHLVQLPKSFYKTPLYYKGNHLSVIGPDEDVIWPHWSEMMDYELELGVIVGRRGKNIDRNDAMSYVFGYSCFNDFSARDVMMKEIPRGVGPIKGKDFDTSNAIGPWVVTADEIPDPYDLKMIVRVNGEVRGQASTSMMSHPIQNMVAVAADEELIVPGEFFGTGAAPSGCGIEQLRFLVPGDVVEIEIERIGVLRNRVIRTTH